MTRTSASSDNRVTVYEPTVTGLPVLRRYVSDLWERRPFIWNVAVTKMKAENYDTVLGQAWIVLAPLLMAAVYLLVRSVIRPIGSGSELTMLISYLIMSLFFFRYSAGSVNQGCNAILGNKKMINTTTFPRMVFPLAILVKAFLEFLPTLFVYLVLHAVLGQPMTATLVLVIPILILQTLFNFGLILFFGTVTVFFKDMKKFMSFLTRLWLFTSPIIYRVVEIPEHLFPWMKFNPMYWYIFALEHAFHGTWPTVGLMLMLAVWAVPVFVIGAVIFMLKERDFATRF